MYPKDTHVPFLLYNSEKLVRVSRWPLGNEDILVIPISFETTELSMRHVGPERCCTAEFEERGHEPWNVGSLELEKIKETVSLRDTERELSPAATSALFQWDSALSSNCQYWRIIHLALFKVTMFVQTCYGSKIKIIQMMKELWRKIKNMKRKGRLVVEDVAGFMR